MIPSLICFHFTGLPLGGRTPFILFKNRLRTSKLHIKDVPQTFENSLVRPKIGYRDVLSAGKTCPHLPDYVIYVPLRIGNSFILFIDHARTSYLTDFESFIDSQCHV